jgi:hypothetical protein
MREVMRLFLGFQWMLGGRAVDADVSKAAAAFTARCLRAGGSRGPEWQ